ncbi:MAG: VCBS repeat-containing protein [Phycisphaerae bacterium]
MTRTTLRRTAARRPCAGRWLAAAALVTCLAAGTAQARVTWVRKSSTTGDLPVPNPGSQQTCCVVGDFDQDGVTDFAVGERTRTPSVVWYKFNGKGWDRFVVDDKPLKPEAGGDVGDVDGDGDPDIVLGQDASGDEMWWWENPNPDFSRPWTRRLVKKGGGRKHHDQTVGDYDGDGRMDLVSWNQRAKRLLLFTIPEDPRRAGPWPAATIYTWKKGREHEGFPSTPVDVDGDGRIDIVGGGRWFRHAGGDRFTVHVIDEAMRFTQCAAGQLVDGGRPEVVFSPGDMNGDLKWYAWESGAWKPHTLRYVVHGHTCEVGDVDGDGHLDIFVGEMGDPGAGDKARLFIWYGDGKGGFTETVAAQGQGIHEGKLVDLDGDGDLDILLKPYHHHAPRIDVLLNGGTGK